MTAAPSPGPVRVIIESSGNSGFWETYGPGIIGVLAILVPGFLAWRSLSQKANADHRTLAQKALADNKGQWWERVQWALDAAHSDDPERQRSGIAMLRVLGEAEWLTDEEVKLLDAAWQEPLAVADQLRMELPRGEMEFIGPAPLISSFSRTFVAGLRGLR